MIARLQNLTAAMFRRVEAVFNVAFTERNNPLYQLGALSFFYFWLVAGTGVYLFIFFDTSLAHAYVSVEQLTRGQWYAGGVMRSVHRYASAAMAVTVTLHLLREFALGRFKGARAFSWISGVPLLWLLFASAIGGYWLVWDQLAQYIAVATAEWFDWLPIFGDPLARNFLTSYTLNDRLFSLLVFMHIALPLFLLIGMFIHIKRIKLAVTAPAKQLALGTIGSMVLVALFKPAVSMGPADLTMSVTVVQLDWIYLNVYPLLDSWGPANVWALLTGFSTLLVLVPWLVRAKKTLPQAVTNNVLPTLPAIVDPANCNGCSWCFKDCPYDAVTMIPHTTKAGHRQAVVNPDLCTACGICAGACPSATPFRHVSELVSGIEIPEFSLNTLRQKLDAALLTLGEQPGVVVFGCDHGAAVNRLGVSGVASISLPCIGMLPPAFADYVSRQPHVTAVMVTGCHTEDCFYRKGSEWTQQRFAGMREPHLRVRTGPQKIQVHLAGPLDTLRLAEEVKRLQSTSVSTA